MTTKPSRKGRRAGKDGGVVRAIAVLKLAKALLLVAVGLGALNLLDSETADKFYRWAAVVAWRLGPGTGSTVERKLSTLQEPRLVVVAIVAFAYAALFGVEGVGLWMKKRWAEFLTIFATSSFVPIEVYELIRHATWARGATLAVNLFVVGYLIWKVRQKE